MRVNAIAPGFVPTNMTRGLLRRRRHGERATKEAVLRRCQPLPAAPGGETNDIAYCVLYLASDASSFVTGQLLSPNGGVAMHY